MQNSIDNFLLEDWTPTPLEQAIMDGTIDEFLAESAEMDTEEILDDFLEVQDFDTAMEELKTELDDDISASETFAEHSEHIYDELVKNEQESIIHTWPGIGLQFQDGQIADAVPHRL